MYAMRILLPVLFAILFFVTGTGCSRHTAIPVGSAHKPGSEVVIHMQGEYENTEKAIGLLMQSGLLIKEIQINELMFSKRELQIFIRKTNAKQVNLLVGQLRKLVDVNDCCERCEL